MTVVPNSVVPMTSGGDVGLRPSVHLLRDVGPKAFADGGDLVLRAPLARSLSRGSPAIPPGTPDGANVIRLVKDG
jgi:hypothetical protein